MRLFRFLVDALLFCLPALEVRVLWAYAILHFVKPSWIYVLHKLDRVPCRGNIMLWT